MSFHSCQHWKSQRLTCPFEGATELHASLELEEGDFDDEDSKTYQPRTQEAVSRFAIRVAAMVSMAALLREGMIPHPQFEKGGIQSILQLMTKETIGADSLSMLGSDISQNTQMSQLEKSLAKQSVQPQKLFRPRREGGTARRAPMLNDVMEDAVRTIAAVGALRAGLEVVKGVSRGFGGGGGGYTFQAPTFRPGLLRKRKDRRQSSSRFDPAGQEVGEIGSL